MAYTMEEPKHWVVEKPDWSFKTKITEEGVLIETVASSSSVCSVMEVKKEIDTRIYHSDKDLETLFNAACVKNQMIKNEMENKPKTDILFGWKVNQKGGIFLDYKSLTKTDRQKILKGLGVTRKKKKISNCEGYKQFKKRN